MLVSLVYTYSFLWFVPRLIYIYSIEYEYQQYWEYM